MKWLLPAFLFAAAAGRADVSSEKALSRIKIGILTPAPGADDRLKRLNSQWQVVPVPGEMLDRLPAIDVLVLSSCWTNIGDDAMKSIDRFVRRGGGVIIFQPNIDGEVRLGDLSFVVQNQYDHEPEAMLEGDPAILRGIRKEDLPYPCDKVVKFDERFRVLVRGQKSRSPSLMIARLGKGRVVACTENDAILDRRNASVKTFHMGDECYRRLVLWAAGRGR